ncbi:MAG: phosphoethanolamine transferase [Clostridiales bacterium]|nr:phosphoethanolamine transferase [Clostridiales bacterium]
MPATSILQRYNHLWIEPSSRGLWAIIMLLSIAGMADIPGASILTLPLWLQWTTVVAIASLKATLLSMMVLIARKWKAATIAVWLIVAVHIFLCLVNFVCYELYGFGISHKLIVVISQTNMAETCEFLPGLMDNLATATTHTGFWAGMAITVIAYVAVRRLQPALFAILTITLSLLGTLSMGCYFMTLDSGRNSFSLSVRTLKDVIEGRREQEAITMMLSQLDNQKWDYSTVSSSCNAHVVLMILGESASRDKLSLYGYPLPTSPRLDAMRDSLVVMNGAIGSSVTTAGNMSRILTLKKDDRVDGDWWNYPLLIDVMKSAGYNTFWLSNQERSGVWGNCSGVLAGRADVVKYLGAESSEDALLKRYDEVLLPELNKVLTADTTCKFIGVHLYGSHTNYTSRYPKNRNSFKAADVERVKPRRWMTPEKYAVDASYLNSLCYTDSVVKLMLDEIARLPYPAIALYFADHGENVYDDRDFIGRDERFVEVPFVVYANEPYRRENPHIVELLNASTDRKFSTANICYTLFTLTGTSYEAYDGKDDILSPEFIERKRYVDEEIWKYDR